MKIESRITQEGNFKKEKKNHVNWNILVTWGKEIKRDSVSSGERK